MLNRFKIGMRLTIAFSLIFSLVAVMGVQSVRNMELINESAQYFSINVVPSFENLHQLAMEFNDLRQYETRYAAAESGREFNELDDRIAASRKKIADLFDEHDKKFISDIEDQAWLDRARNTLNSHFDNWSALRDALRQRLRNPRQTPGNLDALQTSSIKSYDDGVAVIDQWWDYNMRLTGETTKTASETYAAARINAFQLFGLCGLLGMIAAILITVSITRPIDNALEVVRAAADGDLTHEVKPTGRDEVAALLGSMQNMTDGLSVIVRQVRQASDAIATGAAQIASGNTDLSQRTEEQAASLEETSTAMIEVRAALQRNAESAHEATQLAVSASNTAQQGGQVVQGVVATMQDIVSSSKKITEIISVIDGIAFQINLLALNAAVEAARAGEQGRGFAVVASEVRTLAQRSSAAAKEIRQLINSSVAQVESGARLVHEAGGSMNSIVSEVGSVASFISEIGATIAQQSTAFGQIADAVSQLDQVTQQNAALVEESTVASVSLRDQADDLIQAVNRFKLAARYVDEHRETRKVSGEAKEMIRNLIQKPSTSSRQGAKATAGLTGQRQAKGRTATVASSSVDANWRSF